MVYDLPPPRTITRPTRELLPPALTYVEADRLRFVRWAADTGYPRYAEWPGDPDRRVPEAERGA